MEEEEEEKKTPICLLSINRSAIRRCGLRGHRSCGLSAAVDTSYAGSYSGGGATIATPFLCCHSVARRRRFRTNRKKKNYTRIEVSLHLQPSQAIATSPAAYPARCTAAHPMDGSRFSLLQSIGLVATSLNSTVCIPKHQRQFSSNSHGKYWNSRLHWEITDWCTSKRLHRQPGWGGVHPGCTRRCRRSSAHGAARNVYSPLVAACGEGCIAQRTKDVAGGLVGGSGPSLTQHHHLWLRHDRGLCWDGWNTIVDNKIWQTENRTYE